MRFPKTGENFIGRSRLLEEFWHLLKKTFIFSGLPSGEKTTQKSQKDKFAVQLRRQIHAEVQIDEIKNLPLFQGRFLIETLAWVDG